MIKHRLDKGHYLNFSLSTRTEIFQRLEDIMKHTFTEN